MKNGRAQAEVFYDMLCKIEEWHSLAADKYLRFKDDQAFQARIAELALDYKMERWNIRGVSK